MFLNGTAMSGQRDHAAVRDGRLVGSATTALHYRFLAVRDDFPGLLPVRHGGGAIVGELYELDEETLYDSLMPAEPRELELGAIELSDGEIVNAMLLRPERLDPADKVADITEFGGFRAYQAFLAGT
jgi:gamma-glutamylcyclotransferase (GGCT)/AIG2-like uncharacterized protein YtfP